MQTKLSILVGYMKAEQWTKALSLASKFHDLGEHKKIIVEAHEAGCYPDFYKQLGKDPKSMVDAGVEALKIRYAKSLSKDELSS